MANSLNITNIPAPRVPFIDERTGLMAREWYRFFLNLFVLTGSGNNPITLEELQLGPPSQPDLAELLIQVNQNIAPQYEDQSGDFLATLDTAQLMSMMSRFENAEAAIQGAYLQPPQLPVDGVYVVGPGSSTDNAVARFDGTTGKLIQNSVTTIDDTGAATGFTTFAASTSVTTPTVQASNSAGLSLKNASGTTQINMGAGGGDNVSINVSTNLNGANAQIDISPTGTGHVHIKPSGTGSIEIAPTNVGTIDNMTIGATAPKNGSFVDLSVTGTLSFDAAQGTAGQVLTSAGTGATPTWATPTTGTVTAVSVVSANGLAGTVATATTTPAITLSTTVTGLLKGNGTAISAATSGTDYAPATSGTSILYGNGSGGFSNVTIGTGVSFAGGTLSATGSGGTVTSVTGTAPVVSSGGTTPAISMPKATTSVDGYLSSTDWTTFNSKGNGSVTSVAQSFTGGLISVAGSPITSSGTLDLTVAGTSGGIPYFSSASTWATSAALTASALVVGGGAGAAPATITTGTGVVTALGVNTGTAGAFVVNGGALGTPSSGTVTNLTGTASININGTVGATTRNTGLFTTLGANSAVTLSGAAASVHTLGTSATTGTVTIGGTAMTGTLTFGQSTTTNAVNINTGVTASGNTKSTYICTNGAAGSIVNVEMGSTLASTSNTVVNGRLLAYRTTAGGNPGFRCYGTSTDQNYIQIDSTGGGLTALGVNGSVGAELGTGTTAYATVLGSYVNVPVEIVVNNAKVASFASTGLAVTGTLGVTGVATLGNGAILGTPASGTVTNLTGTASININGTVGATTPANGTFTTILKSTTLTGGSSTNAVPMSATVFGGIRTSTVTLNNQVAGSGGTYQGGLYIVTNTTDFTYAIFAYTSFVPSAGYSILASTGANWSTTYNAASKEGLALNAAGDGPFIFSNLGASKGYQILAFGGA